MRENNERTYRDKNAHCNFRVQVHTPLSSELQQMTMSSIQPAQQNFLDAMAKVYKEGESTDAYLVCQNTRKPVHTVILVARLFDL